MLSSDGQANEDQQPKESTIVNRISKSGISNEPTSIISVWIILCVVSCFVAIALGVERSPSLFTFWRGANSVIFTLRNLSLPNHTVTCPTFHFAIHRVISSRFFTSVTSRPEHNLHSPAQLPPQPNQLPPVTRHALLDATPFGTRLTNTELSIENLRNHVQSTEWDRALSSSQ